MTAKPLDPNISYGWVYALNNVSLPGQYKIGATVHDPALRVKQLSASTSVPTPFSLVYSRYVAFPFMVESAIHRALAQYRVNDSREFFQVSLRQVIEEAEKHRAYPAPDSHADLGASAYPFAELFASFPDDSSPRELNEYEQSLCRDLEGRLARGGEIL